MLEINNWYCRISHHLTNNEGLADIWKYKSYFYSSMGMIVSSRNTVRESSHKSIFCGGDPFCEVVQWPENTHRELTGLLEWPAGLCLQSKNHRPYIVFQVPWTCLVTYVFFLFMASYQNLHTSGFFPVICWSYLWTEISVILSTGNKLHSRPHHLFSLSCETTLLMLSCNHIDFAKFIHSTLLLAKLVYYNIIYIYIYIYIYN